MHQSLCLAEFMKELRILMLGNSRHIGVSRVKLQALLNAHTQNVVFANQPGSV